MAGSVNKVTLIGRLGKDPEARSFSNGGKSVSFSMATSEMWNDKASGERKEKTQWHRIVIMNEKIGEIAERYLKKGSACYVEGQIEARKYTDASGAEKEIVEIVIGRFKGELTLLDSKPASDGEAPRREPERAAPAPRAPSKSDLDDEIPFIWLAPLLLSVAGFA